MARLPYLTPDTAAPANAALLRSLPELHVFQLAAHAEDAFGPWLRWSSALLSDCSLDPVLRELAILRVAALSPGADYEWDQHLVIARDVGATDAQIEACRTGEGLDGDAALVVRFTEEVVRDVAPSDATFARFTERFSDRQTMDLLMLIGQYMMVARIAATTRVDPDPPVGVGLLDRMR